MNLRIDILLHSKLLHIWYAMASGESIDEQRNGRLVQRRIDADLRSDSLIGTDQTEEKQADDASDSDQDPNDIPVRTDQPEATAKAAGWTSALYESDDEDDLDF